MSEFLNKPIEGTPSYFTEQVADQHDPQEWIDYLDAILAYPGVEAVRWRQYTPYFNDGDACEFGMHGAEVKIEGAIMKGDWDEDDNDRFWFSEYDLFQYGEGADWEERRSNGTYVVNGFDMEEMQTMLSTLEGLFTYHEVVLQQKFGDPGEVTYDGNGFALAYFDHE